MKRRIGTINEMGIDLKNHGKDSYLGQSHAKSLAQGTGKELYDEIITMVKRITWQDLSIAPINGSYYIVLPQPIQDKIAQLRQVNADLANKLGKWYPMDSTSGVYMNVDSGSNRSHFPGGIPVAMRGLGLGYKCYRRLLEHKTWLTSNTSGTKEKDNAWASIIKKRPDPDDVNAIVGPSNVLAMIKSLSNPRKIEIATNFINNTISKNDITDSNFAIDDELKAILPRELLQTLDPTERMRSKRLRDEEASAETARQTAATQAANEAQYARFGVTSIRHDFRPGEFVVRFSQLTNEYAKPRIIARVGNELKAVTIQNYIEMSQNINYRPTQFRDLGNGADWTNIDIAAIPDLNNVRLEDTEIAYIQNLIQANQRSAPAPHTDQARELAVRTIRRVDTQAQNVNYGPTITVYDQAGYYNVIHNRLLRNESIMKIKQAGFIKEIYMTQAQYSRYTHGKSSEVFVGFNGTTTHMLLSPHGSPQKALNTLTGYVIENPDRKGFAAKFRPIELRSKNDVRQGDMVYIASHPEYYGLTGKVGYLSRHPQTQQEFISVIIYDPTLRGEQYRKVTIAPTMLRKLRITA